MFKRVLMEAIDGNGNDLGGEVKTSPEAQAIIDRLNGVEPKEEESELPSDNNQEPEAEEAEEVLLAGKYKTIDDLKNGIKSIGSDLPDTVIDGMSDVALEEYYKTLFKSFSTKDKRKNEIDDKAKNEETKEDKQKEDKQKEDKPSSAIPDAIWSELTTTFAEQGGITNQQYDKLAELGIPEAIVDNYLDGIKAKQENAQRAMYEKAGGKEQFDVISDWAEKNVPEMIQLANKQTNQEDFFTVLDSIKAKYELSNGSPRRIEGSTRTTGSAYRNSEEYLNDVRDSRYLKDKGYRAKVEEKLKRSKL